jgi:hypothetical protein
MKTLVTALSLAAFAVMPAVAGDAPNGCGADPTQHWVVVGSDRITPLATALARLGSDGDGPDARPERAAGQSPAAAAIFKALRAEARGDS